MENPPQLTLEFEGYLCNHLMSVPQKKAWKHLETQTVHS
jgi:hypothetical protein